MAKDFEVVPDEPRMPERRLTPAQQKVLERRLIEFNISNDRLNEFIAYLRDELGIDDRWVLKQDLSAFVPAPEGSVMTQPPPVE